MKCLYLFFALLVFYHNNFSQIQPDWLRIYNSPEDSTDKLLAMETDLKNNIYIIARTENSEFGTHRVLKYNSTGFLEWVYLFRYENYLHNLIADLKVDTENNIIITGNCINSYTDVVIHLIKLKSDRTLVWDVSYSTNQPSAGKITIDKLSNIYICGSQLSTTFSDYLLLKYDLNGNLIWSRTYDGSAHHKDGTTALFVDSLQNITVSGSSYEENYNIYCTTIQYNINGTLKWIKKFKASNLIEHHYAGTILSDLNFSIYIGGNSDSKAFLLKYNKFGTLKNTYIINNDTNSSDYINAFFLDKYENLYTLTSSGYKQSFLKLDTTLNVLWIENIIPAYNRQIMDVNVDNDYLYKLFYKFDTMSYFQVGKYDLENYQQWLFDIRPDYQHNYFAYMFNLKSNNIYVGGEMGLFSKDIFLAKIGSTIGISTVSNEVPNQFELLQNYPNPFNPVTNIEFKVPKQDFVRVVIYDISGKEIETLVNSLLSAGTYKAIWDGSTHSSGVYFYTIRSGDFTQTRKMVLVK